jgi:hypothetical protein
MAQQINLVNPAFRRQNKHFSATAMAQALGVIALGAVLFSGYAAYKVRMLKQVNAQAESQLAAQRSQLAALVKDLGPQGRSAMLVDELARTEAQVKTRRDLLQRLSTGALGNVKGFSRYLEAFARQKTDGVWLTGISVGGDENDLVVRGRVLRADLVPAYLRALNSEEVMRGRQVTELSLNAVQAPKGAVAPGQPGEASVGAAESRRPVQFVEFNLTAPRRAAEATKPAVDPRKKAPS